MLRNTSITLGNRFDKFAQTQVESGRYSSVSEVVRAGLRMLEEREMKIAALRDALIAGENSGRARYSLKKIMAEFNV
ncbi:MAG: type II toxin-antitoxin system ParD family antitoxin [Proteobacteria bacterium]|nr:type II toxin-antitoxin system ParD family antitoxin [Pseudomonadota bacterium]